MIVTIADVREAIHQLLEDELPITLMHRIEVDATDPMSAKFIVVIGIREPASIDVTPKRLIEDKS